MSLCFHGNHPVGTKNKSYVLFFFSFSDDNSDDYDMDADLDVKWTETGESENAR